MKPIAIIPARGGSKRLPRKNIMSLKGRPLLSYPLSVALECGLFDKVIVSTEDPEIADIASRYGAEIDDRAANLASDTAQVKDVCADLLKKMKIEGALPDVFCCIYPTAVFLEVEDLIQSASLMKETATEKVMGVSSYPLHPYKALVNEKGYLKPAFPEKVKLQSQYYPDYCASNGTFYWAKSDDFIDHPDFYGENLKGYEIPFLRAPDIDTHEDFLYVETLADIMMKKGDIHE